jgi:hypothetical protein
VSRCAAAFGDAGARVGGAAGVVTRAVGVAAGVGAVWGVAMAWGLSVARGV